MSNDTIWADAPLDKGRYLSILRPTTANWGDAVLDEISIWLRGKSIDLDVTRDSRFSSPGRRVRMAHHANGQGAAFQLTLDETNVNGRFVTTVLGVDEGEESWIMIRVLNDRNSVIPSPRLARSILERVTVFDGLFAVGGPRLLHLNEVEEFVHRLEDPFRRGAVFALGTSDRIPPEAFANNLDAWFRDSVGMAQGIVLTPDAASSFNELAGEFAVPEASIRTFGPGLNLSAPHTSRSHRILGTQSLANTSDARIRSQLGFFARTQVDRSTLPVNVSRWERRFERLLNKSISDRVALRPAALPAQSRTPASSSEVERIQAVLGIPDLRTETLIALVEAATRPVVEPEALAELSERIDDLQAQLEESDDALRQVKTDLGEITDEARESADRAMEAEDRLRKLQRAIRASAYDLWAVESEGDALPADFPERVHSWGALDDQRTQWAECGIIITASSSGILELDDLDADGRALDAAYECLRAMAGYIMAKNSHHHEGDFGSYLAAQPSGYPSYPMSRYAYTETKYTKDHHGSERVLPVPLWVNPAGQRAMNAHVKLTKIPNRDPRIHFVDAVHEEDGAKLIVGYIGPHLTNRATAKLN
jgi:hypothetical protein